ncbi:ATP-binding protein [Streptomyces sp. NBC_01439]|uniref:ATP-binding protein n=1 Tax=Streptomyces sp. NBC_01439 TaxID=2903867 RepID=UPI002E2B95FF|nr:ATP-binding protein [Streptomyces sp. NBC_01439]
MSMPLRDLLADWPDRFRHQAVLVALAADKDPDPRQLAMALLDTYHGPTTPTEVYHRLLEAGEFELADGMLTDCRELRDGAANFRQALGSARAAADEAVRLKVAELRRRAENADIAPPAGLDTDDLRKRTRLRTAPVATLLAQHEKILTQDIATAVDALRASTVADERGPARTAYLNDLLAAGQLRVARAVLEREPPGALLPEAVPQLQPWRAAFDPDVVCQVLVDPSAPRVAEYQRWEPADPVARALLDAYDDLMSEESCTRQAVVAFTSALGRFLGTGDQLAPVTARPDGAGFLTSLDGLFAEDPLRHLHDTDRVDLFVSTPNSPGLPSDLAGLQQCIAVGRGLTPSGYLGGEPCAVLSTRDLLRLLPLTTHRPTAMLRLLARQWPLSVLAGRSPKDLNRLLGDGETRWQRLRWIVDLAGLGDAVVVDEMESATGFDIGLLHTMLHRAAPDQPRTTLLPGGRFASWQGDTDLVRAMEEHLEGRCQDEATLVTLWATLYVAEPDGRVRMDDVRAVAAMVATGKDTAAAVAAGAAALAADGFLRPDDEADHWLLPRAKVLGMLAQDAEERLTRAVARLPAATATEPTDAQSALLAQLTGWRSNRHRLAPDFAAYQSLTGLVSTDRDKLLSTASRVLAQTEAGARLAPDGSSRLDHVLRELAAELGAVHPQVEVDIRCPANAYSALSADALRVVFYEILENAAESVSAIGGGTVQVIVQIDDPDLVVDVLDSGEGLVGQFQDRPTLVFRKGRTTKGPHRGDGLHQVRSILADVAEGPAEITLGPAGDAHPTLRGVHVRLDLPQPARRVDR